MADLATKEDVAALIAKRNCQLLAMKVDAKVQHDQCSPGKAACQAAVENLGEPHRLVSLLQENLSSTSFIESSRCRFALVSFKVGVGPPAVRTEPELKCVGGFHRRAKRLRARYHIRCATDATRDLVCALGNLENIESDGNFGVLHSRWPSGRSSHDTDPLPCV